MKLEQTLRRVMKDRALTLTALSELSGIKKSTLSDWSNGVHPRDLVEVRKLARSLGLVFGDEDTANPLPVLPTELVFDGFLKVKIERIIQNQPSKK
jgi:transcriptional regulator with XRE-family HTH domain